jgi:hypothetical protein
MRSAYFIKKERRRHGMAECSSKEETCEIWKRLWALPIPSVEKNFLWRAYHDILPTRENLCKKNIIEESLCPLCGLAIDMDFISFSNVRLLWMYGA